MTSPPPAPSLRCPECGAAVRQGALRCWLCGRNLAEAPVDAIVLPPATADTNSATFSLSSIFLVMTLVAVGCGIAAAAPGLGVLFVIVATPALVRTIVVTSRQKSHGAATTPGEKAVAFLGSVGVVLLVFLSIGVALFTACLTACAGGAVLSAAGDQAMIAGAVTGGAAGLALAGWIFWLLWHQRRKA